MASLYEKVIEMRNDLSPSLQAKFTMEGAKEFAASLQDGAVFDIVRELEEIQQLNERSLLTKRMKVVGEHKRKKMEMMDRHKRELKQCQPHEVTLTKSRHDKEKNELERKIAEEIRTTDQSIILELDQLVFDQQNTLHQAAVPYFTVTNSSSDIQLQSALLTFILKLSVMSRQ